VNNAIKASGLLALVTILLTCSTACSKYYDAWFANPCDSELTVRTYVGGVEKIGDNFFMREARIPAASMQKVDDAFADAAGWDWAVVIVEKDAKFPVDGRKWKHSTVLIPAEFCANNPQ
jgi:hypothetical protein